VASAVYCDGGSEIIEYCQAPDRVFIASCAGPAEAGWRATIAAIDAVESVRENDLTWQFEEMASVIIAAWPEELL
jgi:hypothetical protein